MRRTLALLVAVGSATLGCDDGTTPPAVVTISDSAGIRIVVSHAPAWSQDDAWKLVPEPSLRIGSATVEDELLHDVRDVDRLSDGRWVITHTGSSELRVYSPEGDFVEVIGREGQGPGEFTFPTATWIGSGDSMVVREFQRVSFFASDGTFSHASPSSPWPPQDRFSDGTFLFDVIPPGVDTFEPGFFHPDQALLRAGADGADADTLLVGEGTELFRFRSSAGGVSSHFAPFGAVRTAVVDGESIYTSSGRLFEVSVLDGNGELRSIIRRSTPSRPVTDQHIQTLETSILESAPVRTHPDRRRMFLEWRYPDQMPAVDRLLMDAEGHLWVRAYDPAPKMRREWSVIDPGGRWLGQVTTPEAFEVMDIGTDYVAGVFVDDLGVEYVQVFPLQKPAA
jgi:hypothetical protein